MIFFYNKNDGKIYSYVAYNLESELTPSKLKCSTNNGINESDIGIAEFLINDPIDEDFKDNINDLDSGDYDVIA